MRRQLCWTEKLDDGVKREIRVSFPGGGKIRWQAKSSDRLEWEYDFQPSTADWDALLQLAERWYNRRRMPLPHLEMIRKARSESAAD